MSNQSAKLEPHKSLQVGVLASADLAHFEAHLLRLTNTCRRMRFGGHVPDEFLRNYARNVDLANTAVVGVLSADGMHGAAELRSFSECWDSKAEAAFSVDRECRGRGIGRFMMAALIQAARHRRVQEIFLTLNPTNHPMRRIIERFAAHVETDGADLQARISMHREDLIEITPGSADGSSIVVLDLK